MKKGGELIPDAATFTWHGWTRAQWEEKTAGGALPYGVATEYIPYARPFCVWVGEGAVQGFVKKGEVSVVDANGHLVLTVVPCPNTLQIRKVLVNLCEIRFGSSMS